MNIQKHFQMLGLKVRDRVTGLTGVVVSIGFDLYGCIQCVVHPGTDKDDKMRDSLWFDIARLEALSSEPVMTRPNYEFGPIAEGRKGSAEKPTPHRA